MSDCVRDLRSGDFAWFNKSIFQLDLGWKANLIYMGLVSYANGESQSCFPSKNTLARLLGVSKRTVFDGLKALEDAKLIKIQERPNDDGIPLSNIYTLLSCPGAQYALGHNTPQAQYALGRNTHHLGVIRPITRRKNKKNIYCRLRSTTLLIPPPQPEVVKPDPKTIVRELFEYYRQKCNRQHYDLTEQRMEKVWSATANF